MLDIKRKKTLENIDFTLVRTYIDAPQVETTDIWECNPDGLLEAEKI